MAVLEWDKTGERFYETGLSKGVLYPMASDGNGYDNGVVWNGLTGVTESPSGAEASDLYADNIKYGTMYSTETFGATIEAYTYPDEFAACDGSAEPITGLKIGQQSRKAFGFCYRTAIGNDTMTDADDGYLIHIIYNAVASPSEKSYATINDSPEAITFSWEVTTTPVTVGGNYKPTSYLCINSLKFSTSEQQAKLKALEDLLYGSASAEATLPDPATVITTLGGTVSSAG